MAVIITMAVLIPCSGIWNACGMCYNDSIKLLYGRLGMSIVYMVYKTKNLKTEEYYIGVHKTRWLDDDYLGSGARLRRAILEHGVENFERTVLLTYEDRATAYAKEEELVSQCLGDPLCYNVHTGGIGGVNGASRNNSLPLPVQRALRSLGKDIRNAKLRRRIQSAILSERSGISRGTLIKIERGDPGVSIGCLASVLHSLGMVSRMESLAGNDEVGGALQSEDDRIGETCHSLYR
jgi:hypothetical protein